jgi:nitrogen-specific signal transduction histidine kinase
MKTLHASPERSSQETMEKQFHSLDVNNYLSELINALPYVVTILNANRQIVFSNQVLVQALKVSEFKELLGKRPGEALNCIHSRTVEEGCGTSENCQVCGAVNSITTSIKENRKVVNECRITTENEGIEEYFDYEVTATPFVWQEEKYTVFSLADISGVKRKRMLERIFFHDILNTAGNLRGLSELIIQIGDTKKRDELTALLGKISNELVEEIQEQRQLSAAEAGELNVSYAMVNTGEIFETLVGQFESHIKKPVTLLISRDSENLSFSSDKSLLTRILKNMVKNAIEASSDGDTITISANLMGSLIRFTVHNPNFIPRNIQLQIFKRSFSTKGTDRGLGTYSMKLLGERFLKGKVHFSSNEKTGTDFYFDLPLS